MFMDFSFYAAIDEIAVMGEFPDQRVHLFETHG
jgi:hypothetical protein